MRELILVAGTKASSKTVTTKNKIADIKNRNILIFDVNMEYNDFEILPVSKIAEFSKSKDFKTKRIVPITRGKNMSLQQIGKLVVKILSQFNNGVLVLESIGGYAPMNKKIYDMILSGNKKQKERLTIICIFQSISSIPRLIYNKSASLRLHYTCDGVDRCRGVKHFEILKIANLIVTNKFKEGDRFFHCTINRWETIFGNFDKQDYRNACLDYVNSERGLYRYCELFK